MNVTDVAREERGMALLRQLAGEQASEVADGLKRLSPDMWSFLADFAYGSVLSRPALDIAKRQLATVAILTALGHSPTQLRFHIGAALNVGCGPEEILEVILQTAVYAGFPAALNALAIMREVFRDRGIVVQSGGG